MGRIETSIEIEAKPEKVWETLALDGLPEWSEGLQKSVKSVEYTSEVRKPKDKLRASASAQEILKKEGESVKLDFDITESLENEEMTYQFSFPMMGARMHVTNILEPMDEGTKLTYVIDYKMSWGEFSVKWEANWLPEEAAMR